MWLTQFDRGELDKEDAAADMEASCQPVRHHVRRTFHERD
jgi:hypothetical protein